MAINLEKYIQETFHPQKFIVKIAQQPEKENVEYMKKMLEYKGMTSMTNFKKLPFQPTPTDFPIAVKTLEKMNFQIKKFKVFYLKIKL